jgi:hypothetical protein
MRRCRGSLEIGLIGYEGLKRYAEGKYHIPPTLRKYLVKIHEFTKGLPSCDIFRVSDTGCYRLSYAGERAWRVMV